MKHSLADFTSALPAKIPTEPESPFAPVDEEGRPYLPLTIGPASRSKAPPDNPMSVRPPNIDPGPSLLAADDLMMAARAPGWAFRMSWSIPPFHRGVLDGADPVANRPPRPTEHLATTLNWRTHADGSEPACHPQTQIRLGDVVISVDEDIAEIVEWLNRYGLTSLTSCCLEPTGFGYVMMPLAESKKFLRFWEEYMVPRGWELPALSSFELRDEQWRQWMKAHYPPRLPLDVDEFDHSYTTCWRFPSEQLAELRDPLCTALRRAIRNERSGRWSWAASLHDCC